LKVVGKQVSAFSLLGLLTQQLEAMVIKKGDGGEKYSVKCHY
jgi:hypothetical protein